ncbi:hypothetical protein IG631_14276 [Alternaria alternata]|nr:hypothetical protein IG631_14276 [Alternaria alternata]
MVFGAAELVLIHAQAVLDRLEVRLRTPPEPLLLGTPWQSKTPSNTHGIGWLLSAHNGWWTDAASKRALSLADPRACRTSPQRYPSENRKSTSGISKVTSWGIELLQRRRQLRLLQDRSNLRELVITNRPNQLYSAVENAAGLTTTHGRANRGRDISCVRCKHDVNKLLGR